MAHDVFISHSVKDKTTADAVCAMLEAEGIRCWIAPRDVTPGMEWGAAIIGAIKQSRVMVLVFTANANASPQIRKELERAVHHDVVVLPLRIENILPDESLEYFIGNVHWLDALTPPLEAHLKSLAGTIKVLLARIRPGEEQTELQSLDQPLGTNQPKTLISAAGPAQQPEPELAEAPIGRGVQQPLGGAAATSAGLTQLQRITYTFTAPSKTFEDIKSGNRSWWLPFVLFIVVGTALWGSVTVRVGWEQVVDNGLRFAPKQAEQLHSLTPAQQEKQEKIGAVVQEVLWGLGPIWVLLFNVVAAAVLLGTINFGFGGRATFGEVLSVSWYAGLPGLIKLALGAIGLWVGIAPESFMPGNPAGTNVGYYFSPGDMPMALWTLLASLDVTFIWTLVLFSKGLAKVAGTKPSIGYFAVFGWFVLYLLLQIGFASAFS